MARGRKTMPKKTGRALATAGTSVKSGRSASIKRTTKETDIEVAVNLDGKGVSNISTGVGFFDHMLDLLARHSRIDITVEAKGDLHIDHHHTTEDVGIALGQAVKQALGDMKGITRYADVHVPMDEALTRVAIDISGRRSRSIRAPPMKCPRPRARSGGDIPYFPACGGGRRAKRVGRGPRRRLR